MYIPSIFEERRPEVLYELVRRFPLATVITNSSLGLEANHIPLQWNMDKNLEGTSPKGTLRGHIAKANNLWRQATDGSEVLVVFQGPEHYVSPNWYPSKQQHGEVVPTWNYAVVHIYGQIRWIHDTPWLKDFLKQLTESHESAQPVPWHMSDAPEAYIDRMLKAVVGLEIVVDRVLGKWKVSQNRSSSDRESVAEHFAGSPDPACQEMASMVRVQTLHEP